MKLTLEIKGLEKVQKKLRDLTGQQGRQAIATAINDVAFATRKAWQAEQAEVFDGVTPYIQKSIQVKKATAAKLEATVEPTYMGGKGVDPQKILRAEVFGGPRGHKRFEVSLQRAGLMPANVYATIPKKPFPGSVDDRGNLRGPFIVKLLSLLQAFGEQGYRANAKQKTIDKFANRGKVKALKGSGYYVTINGWELFVVRDEESPGYRLRGIWPGIWARRGIHGVDIQPIVLFSGRANYQKRLDLKKITDRAGGQAYFERRLRRAIYNAWEKGRAT